MWVLGFVFRGVRVVDGEGVESICGCYVGMVGGGECVEGEVGVWESVVGDDDVYEFCE